MIEPVIVRIFGMPTASDCGPADAWREITDLVRQTLVGRFGGQVVVEYHDLFSPEMAEFPEILELVKREEGHLPLVRVDDRLLSSGGKVSIPQIRRYLEAKGAKAVK
ncbi:MAG: hypothetical protein ACETWB_05300 [Anaerolineae bacterium]